MLQTQSTASGLPVTLRSIGLALLLTTAAGLSGHGLGCGSETVSGLFIWSSRELTARLPIPSSLAPSTTSVTAGFRG